MLVGDSAEAGYNPSDWYFLTGSTNITIFWNCIMSGGDTYVIAIVTQATNLIGSGVYPPYREGYTFMGWSTSEDGEVMYTMEEVANGTAPIDTVLYAVWA